MASATASIATTVVAVATTTTSSLTHTSTTSAQGNFESAGQGISGGYTGDSLSLKIVIAFLIGLSLYNAIEVIVLILVTFNKYSGTYFWSLVVAGVGIIPYSLSLLIKYFQLLDPNADVGYVAIVMLTVGWYAMITGQSFVLWSRLHLVTNSARIIKYARYMIIIDGLLLHSTTTVLTFGANSNDLSPRVRERFIYGYSVMEKIQMVGFFLQELIISVIYIKETLRILKLSQSVKGDIEAVVNVKERDVRKTMWQLITINAMIIIMDVVLLSAEFANLYIIETTLKGAIYSIKLKLEFAVLGRLVQIVRNKNNSGNLASSETRQVGGGIGILPVLERSPSDTANWPDFVGPRRIGANDPRAESAGGSLGFRLGVARDGIGAWEREGCERERWKKRKRESWIDEEMDKHNIG
ncbi:hypothetical protein K504DRAFT_483326 [Pleomassaria siparia CBS 279.74]|uniref:DUF7703 domain-containing protein n=1 Tax=Pleomassaria siparia CBS 279.74 TaxID=1314801 RepID=A0A6G1K331_9PLEO|nr:hypothetical protein K504DRAFT_483326 [Pleomassaria siparia CBS 279.74]